MEQTVETIKVRIESLQHTRQLITFLAGGLTGVYTVIGLLSANLEAFFGSGQTLWSWLSTGWSVLVLGLLLTLGSTNICFILSVFLLTDSIHNYSKILEYRQGDLFADTNDEAILAHHRALAADDLSYYYLRVGVFFLVFNLLLAMLTVVTLPMPSLPFYVAPIGVLVCALVAFFLVLRCYRVSHYKVPEHSLGKAIGRFWNSRRWRNAVRRLHRELADQS
ncbi:MAG: hypothetical protein SVX38_08995 [Chloroflexota bacterium]|nr:hypothetical protein [Chloroflexota bacterium]